MILSLVALLAAATPTLQATDAGLAVAWPGDLGEVRLLVDGEPLSAETPAAVTVRDGLSWQTGTATRKTLTARRIVVGLDAAGWLVIESLSGRGTHFLELLADATVPLTAPSPGEWLPARAPDGMVGWRAFIDLPATIAWGPDAAPRVEGGLLTTRGATMALGSGAPLLIADRYELHGDGAIVLDDGRAAVFGGALLDLQTKTVLSDRHWPIDVSKDWAFHLDPKDEGTSAGWMAPDLDERDWSRIDTGANWEPQGHPGYDGLAWYRKRIDLPLELQRLGGELRFGGIDDDSWIWVDGEPAGEMQGWNKPRTIVIPAGRGSVVVAIKVKDNNGPGGIHAPGELWPPAVGD